MKLPVVNKFIRRKALLIVHSSLLIVFILSLFTLTLTFLPKSANAQLPDGCYYNFSPDTVAAGSSIKVDIAGVNKDGNTIQVGILDGATSISTKTGTIDPTSDFVIINVPIPSTATPKTTYIVLATNLTTGETCAIRAPSTSTNLTITADPVIKTEAVDCGNVRPKTDRGAFDKWLKTGICNNNLDSVYFGGSQVYTIADSIYGLLFARSRLHPETDNVTKGTGAITATGRLAAALYAKPPASGVQYLAQQIQKVNPVQPAYAQGIGFQTLTPFQVIWEGFRNITYVGFVIVFVIVGFMIMFRAHISPQAVATVQDSLPRIVIALVLVTFSYAIAGLMIDIMFLFLNVAINALPVSGAAQNVFTKSVFGVITGAWTDIFGMVADKVAGLIDQVVDIKGIDKILGFFGGGLAAIVVGIAMLFVMFKVFISLLMAYATIIILTIFAPFFFLLQALPGNNSAQTWFKQMAANVAVFPTVAIMFVLAGYIGGISDLGASTPAISETQGNITKFPLLAGDLDPTILGKLAGIGLLLMTPAAAQMVKDAIGAKGGPNVGAGVGAALASGAGVVGAGATQARRAAWEQGPVGEFRKMRQARAGEERQRQVELESVAAGRRSSSFYKK